jgi:hypothetical protein
MRGDDLQMDGNNQQDHGVIPSSNTVQNNDTDNATLLYAPPGENSETPAKYTTDTTTQIGGDPHGQEIVITQRGQQKRGEDTCAASEREENMLDTIDTDPMKQERDKTQDDATLSLERTKNEGR